MHKTRETLSAISAKVASLATFENIFTALGGTYGLISLTYLQNYISRTDSNAFEALTALGCMSVSGGLFHYASKIRKQSNLDRIFLDKQRMSVKDFNTRLYNDFSETFLVALTAEDHNGAFELGTSIKIEQFQRIAKRYHVHFVLVEKPEDYDRAWEDLRSKGKTILHTAFLVHGSPSGVELADRKIRDYLNGKNIDRCILQSCSAGAKGGEAEKIAQMDTCAKIYAPREVSYSGSSSFIYLDAEDKPALIQIQPTAHHVLTDVFSHSIRESAPIVQDAFEIEANALTPYFFQGLRRELQTKALAGDRTAMRTEHYIALQKKIAVEVTRISNKILWDLNNSFHLSNEFKLDLQERILDLRTRASEGDPIAQGVIKRINEEERRGKLLYTYEINEDYFPSPASPLRLQ